MPACVCSEPKVSVWGRAICLQCPQYNHTVVSSQTKLIFKCHFPCTLDTSRQYRHIWNFHRRALWRLTFTGAQQNHGKEVYSPNILKPLPFHFLPWMTRNHFDFEIKQSLFVYIQSSMRKISWNKGTGPKIITLAEASHQEEERKLSSWFLEIDLNCYETHTTQHGVAAGLRVLSGHIKIHRCHPRTIRTADGQLIFKSLIETV